MTTRRIYYADTDAGGVVYYANYLRFLEEGRTEFLRARGLSIRALQERGYLIPVMRLEIDYLIPALLDDQVRVETEIRGFTAATCTLGQRLLRVPDGALLVDAQVTLACLGPGQRARRFPAELLQAFREEPRTAATNGDGGPEHTGDG